MRAHALPDFWRSEVSRIQHLIAEDAETASFEATYLAYAAEALAEAQADLAEEHAPALRAVSLQLKTRAERKLQARAEVA